MTRAAPAKKQGSLDIDASVQGTTEDNQQLLVTSGRAETISGMVSMAPRSEWYHP